MVDVTINLNEAKKATSDIKSSLDKISYNSLEIMTSSAAMLDNLLKGVNAFGSALKEAQNSLSGGIDTTSITGMASSAPQTLAEQLTTDLDILKKSLAGFDSTKTLIDSFTLLPEIFFQQLEGLNGLAEQSSLKRTFAQLDSQLTTGTITLGGYTTELTKTVEELKKSEAAAKQFSEAISKSADNAQAKLQEFQATSITGLIDTFSKTVAEGGDLGNTMSKKLNELGTQLLDNVINSLLKDLANGLINGQGDSIGSGLSGFFNNFDTLFSNILSNIYKFLFCAQGDIFDPYGLQRFARGGIINQPTLFPFANGIGLMGEAGPEAIMPLARDGRGNLGVHIAEQAAYGGGDTFISNFNVEVVVENNGGGEMTEEQARALGNQINAAVEMKVAKQMYDCARSGMFRSGAGRAY